MEYFSFSWEKTEESLSTISKRIKETGFNPDVIIAISRGGLIPARILSDLLNVPLLYTIRISFYSSVGVKKENPEITQPLSVDISGKNILLVDDISDSGKSLELADNYLASFNPAKVKSATIHLKPASIFKPDFFHKTTNAWIVYPWETKEFFRETGKRVEEL